MFPSPFQSEINDCDSDTDTELPSYDEVFRVQKRRLHLSREMYNGADSVGTEFESFKYVEKKVKFTNISSVKKIKFTLDGKVVARLSVKRQDYCTTESIVVKMTKLSDLEELPDLEAKEPRKWVKVPSFAKEGFDVYASRDGKIKYQDKIMPAYVSSDIYFVSINNTHRGVKRLVAEAFMSYKNSRKELIFNLDGNIKNCAVENLIIRPRKAVMKQLSAVSKNISVRKIDLATSKTARTFTSVSACMEHLGIKARKTFYDMCDRKDSLDGVHIFALSREPIKIKVNA